MFGRFAISVATSPPGLEFLRLGLINRRPTTFVDACRFGVRDTLKLPLASKVGFELGEYAKHDEEALAGGCTDVDRPLCGLQDGAADSVQHAGCPADRRCCQAIDPGYHQHVTVSQKAENRL